MATAKKLPSGSWRVRAKNKNKVKSFTASTKKEAELMAAQWLISMYDDPSPTVAEALAGYVRSKEAVLSPSTVRGYEQIRTRYFDEIGHLKLSALDSPTVQNFVSNLSLTRSPKTVRNIYGLLISTLQMYLPDKTFKITLPQKVPVKRTVPTDEQIKALLNNASPHLKTAILLGSFGLRRGEVCALTYEDVFPDMGFIQINKDMVQNKDSEWIVKPMPKTSSSFRVVRVPKEVIESIGEGTGRIYPYNPNSLTQAFSHLRDNLQINVSFHSLRRYMASILHALGFPDKYIQQMGGWSSPAVMQKCYENVLEDKNVEYTKKMNDYYSETFLKNEA